MDRPEKVFLPNSEHCFVCGEINAAGLQTRFFVEDGVVKAELAPRTHHCGYPNVLHGGVVAAVLDECMGWAAARAIERMCVTAEMTLRYIKPVPADRTTTACAEVVRASKRLASAKGVIVDEDGTEYVRAEARFMPLSVEQTLHVDDNLLYRGGEERVFDTLRQEANGQSEGE